jgi:hypothetical protein
MKSEKFGTIYSAITSTVALCLAAAAYWNSISTRREDVEYRELSIRPALARGFEMSDFSVRVKNRGLGPAWIKRIGGNFEGQCYRFDERNYQAWADFHINHVVPFVLARLDTALREAGIRFQGRLSARASMLSPNSLIHKDEEMIVVALESEAAAAITKLVREHQAENEITKKFTAITISVPLFMQYCSITEKWCFNQDTNKQCLRGT